MASNSRSSKHSRRVALVLLMGLLTSIVIAWSVAAFRPPPQYPRTVFGAFERWNRPWSIAESHSIGTVEIWWDDMHFDSPNDSTGECVVLMRALHGELVAKRPGTSACDSPRVWGVFVNTQAPPAPVIMGADAGFGWPALCLWDQVRGDFTRTTRGISTSNEELHGGWLLTGAPSARGRDFISLPLRPIWWGLILNTLFFAFLWWLAFFATGTLRRSSRHRRGRCLACGYDLRGNFTDGCPECGWQR